MLSHVHEQHHPLDIWILAQPQRGYSNCQSCYSNPRSHVGVFSLARQLAVVFTACDQPVLWYMSCTQPCAARILEHGCAAITLHDHRRMTLTCGPCVGAFRSRCACRSLLRRRTPRDCSRWSRQDMRNHRMQCMQCIRAMHPYFEAHWLRIRWPTPHICSSLCTAFAAPWLRASASFFLRVRRLLRPPDHENPPRLGVFALSRPKPSLVSYAEHACNGYRHGRRKYRVDIAAISGQSPSQRCAFARQRPPCCVASQAVA